MFNELHINKKSLFFAPLEGLTDHSYREIIHQHFPEWDYLCTDFLRLPVTGKLWEKHFIEHIGEKIWKNEAWRKKTVLQILTSEKSQTEDCVKCINDMDISWLDLNLGCPTKLVNNHFGGAYLLSDQRALVNILKTVRKNFKRRFSVKTRTGYEDTKNFPELLKIYEGEGVDLIFLHARTKKDFYEGKADWNFIQKAVGLVKIPIVGNGDLLNAKDIRKMFDETDCHSVMIGRGAIINPWLADEYRGNEHKKDYLFFIDELERIYTEVVLNKASLLKRLKGISAAMFTKNDDKSFLRSKTIQEFKDSIKQMFN